ncbi:type II toxin-antitoxin system death-on-curing family toxin [Marixanthomonas spongiae]|uniref:Type II toxin-antitoxin system death-on-curing family toxin n=1 Tax=Marixanthomonas spongiae TaxID=2174845 RepID=A0A2U0HWW9_9FLAO|nr:type II toxin-antitoxin system death-on-curing family toxin [Marixanthomonas spongiae]PVW13326.1 type II toxin-antitoxin system death-on-curing family toxin [Marixanthomonas spongiae]
MISIQLAEKLNKIIIKASGGSAGIRDKKGLSSALNRPFQTFDGEELYSSSIEKAAAIFESIIINHPFIDGNKRMAYALMRLILAEGNMDIQAPENTIYDFVISASKGNTKFDDIKEWISNHIAK